MDAFLQGTLGATENRPTESGYDEPQEVLAFCRGLSRGTDPGSAGHVGSFCIYRIEPGMDYGGARLMPGCPANDRGSSAHLSPAHD